MPSAGLIGPGWGMHLDTRLDKVAETCIGCFVYAATVLQRCVPVVLGRGYAGISRTENKC